MEHSPFGKSIVIPNRLQMAIIHGPWFQINRVKPYEHKTFPDSVASAFHLRNPVYEQDSKEWNHHFKNLTRSINEDYSLIDRQFQSLLQNNSLLNMVKIIKLLRFTL